MDDENANSGHGWRVRALGEHRLSDFAYGTVTGIVALGGLDHEIAGLAWWHASAIVIVGAAALWIAHAYASLLGKRVAGRRRLEVHELVHGLRGSSAIVGAGIVLSVPLAFAGLHLCSLTGALTISRGLGVALLALLGLAATSDSWPQRLLRSEVATVIGLAVVAVETAVHR